MTDRTRPTTRQGSAPKRAGILAAARELFLADGYERTSLDAVSARAGVSKRTVYDYFGDKRAVFAAVVEAESSALAATVEAAIADELSGDAELDAALLAVARRLATQTLASSHYAALRRLLTAGAVDVPGLVEVSPAEVPERLLTERFAALARAGRLEVDDPRRAAEHFVALTILLALHAVQLGPWEDHDAERVDAVLVDGVRAFLRAYGLGPPPAPPPDGVSGS